MTECVRFGHEVVCLAHLRPRTEQSADDVEIDSFVFPSVGHPSVRLIAESMELPLVSETITDGVKKLCESAAGDEVEDLFRLLEQVKQQFRCNRNFCCWYRIKLGERSGTESLLTTLVSVGRGRFCLQKDKYQMNVCGENGEYETFTLDWPLFKKRIFIYVL